MDLKNIIQNIFKKEQKNNWQPVNAFWGANNQGSTSLQSMGRGLNVDGSVRVGLSTYFQLIKKNWILSGGIRFLTNKIGGYGFYFVNDRGVTITVDQETISNVKRFFAVPQMRSYIYLSLISYLTAGQKVATATKLTRQGKATGDATINILDPRMLSLVIDYETGEVTRYDYRNKQLSLELPPKLVNDDILYPDLDRDGYGQSMMESIVMDTMTDMVTGARNFHFYRNNATPGTVFALKDGMTDEQAHDLEGKINSKFGGNANNGKPLASTAIDKVHTIEVPNIDTIAEREMLMKIITSVLGIDPRILGYMKDTGAYAEIDAVARGITNSKLKERSEIIEQSMQAEYEKFVGPLPGKIKLDTIYFTNQNLDKEMALKEVQAGIMTPDDYKALFDI